MFDEWNRLSSRTDPASGAVGYTYWPTDQVKRLTYPGLQTPVAYEIDGRQFLRTVTDWAQRVTSYTYRPNGQVSSIAFPNGAATVFSFDNASRLTGVSHTAAGLVVAQYAVVLDALGQPTTGSAILPLPPPGPPAAHAFTYTEGNQFATADGAAIAYDADGNFQGVQGQPAIVEYDVYGHVIGVNQARMDRFGYDVDGLRTSATLGGETRAYVFDVNGYRDAQVERGDPERVLTAAVLAPTRFGEIGILPIGTGEGTLSLERAIDRLLEIRDASQQVRYRYLHGLGVVLQEDASGAYRVLHDDLAGNIVALTDATGAIVDRSNYDPFGQTLGGDGASFMPFRFGGRYGVQDDRNGFLHMRARAYAPQQMRFLQPDYFLGTAYRPQTLNSYAYVMGNPLQGVDPLGLDTWKIVLGVGLGVAGLAGLAGLGYYLYQSGGLTTIGTFFSTQFGRLVAPRGPQYIPMQNLGPRVPANVPRVPTTQSPVQSTSVYNSGLSSVRQRFLSRAEQAAASDTDLFEMTDHIKSH